MVEYATLHRYDDEFWVIGEDSGLPIRVRWRWEPSRPTRRQLGITGWAFINGVLGRLHVCAHTPCGAKWAPSVYGVSPVPTHGRLHQGDPPAVAGAGSVGSAATVAATTAAAAPASPEHAMPAAEALGPSAPTPKIPTPPAPPTPPTVGPETCGGSPPAVAGIVGAESPPLPPPPEPPAPLAPPPLPPPLFEVASPPSPPKPPPPPVRPISPPRRAALLVGHAAAPCPPLLEQAKALAVPPKAMVMAHPAAGAPAEGAEGEEEVIVGELVSEHLARTIHAFVDDVSAPRRYIGIAAILLFALLYKLRVRVWFGAVHEDVVDKYASWATAFITKPASFEVIGCRITDDGICMVENAKDVNHWVACVATDARRHGDGEPSPSDTTQTLQGLYLSLNRIVVFTVADGDCGFDVMCLMIGAPRRVTTRTKLRTCVGGFLLKHAGNRAVVAAMFGLAEITLHLGMFELETT